MSRVLINTVDQDLIEIDFFQHGQNHTETTLNQALINGEKSYHFCVSNLSIPLKHAPIHPVKEDTMLFRVRRRVAGQTVQTNDVATTVYQRIRDMGDTPDFATLKTYVASLIVTINTTDIADSIVDFEEDQKVDLDDEASVLADPNLLRVWALEYVDTQTTFPTLPLHISKFVTSPSRPMYSVSQFVQAIQQYCEQLNQTLTTVGLVARQFGMVPNASVDGVEIENQGDVLRYLDIETSCDSSLIFKPGSDFFQFYAIEMSGYGASLLGINVKDLHPNGPNFWLCPTGDSYTTTPFNGFDFVGSLNTENVMFTAHNPIYSTADQRIKVSVSSHLPILSNVIINNEKQSSERDIAEAFFENVVKSEVHYKDGALSTRLISKVYSGQCNMIRKHDEFHQWNKLISSYRLRYMRFYVFITYRDYQTTTNTFALRKLPLTVTEPDYWSFTLKFVSDT